MNEYGRFDDNSREYVISRPDTPLPWLNYLGNDGYYGLCTNTLGGYTFYKDAKLRRVTRYRYNNVPADLGGRYLYIKDGDTIWNPGWKPVKTKLDSYECRHGVGYSKIIAKKDDVEVEINCFIPLGETTEIWKTTVRNKGSKKKDIKLFSFVEFCLFEAANDMNNLQRTLNIGEVEVEGSAIYHKTEYRERRNHYSLFSVSRGISGYDTSRDEFVGVHNGLHEPNVVLEGKAKNSHAHGWNPIGSHQIDLDLEAGAEETFSFLLAYIEQDDGVKFTDDGKLSKDKAYKLMEKYGTEKGVDDAFKKLNAYWENLLGGYQVNCPNEHVQRMANTWNQYQCMVTFNLSRSASLYETGIGRGMGFRDSNQDLLGFLHMAPDRARERILDIAATQLSSGTCYHQYQPLTKKGNTDIGTNFNDDPLWLVLSTVAYIKETGDASILSEKVPYADDEKNVDTLQGHLETSIRYTLENLGPNNLPLIGHADWNDCLNLNCFSTEPNESFQTAGDDSDSDAESVMIAGLFLYAARDLKDLYTWLGKKADADRVESYYKQMLSTVEEKAWDGDWYLRAFDAKGEKIGSKSNEEGQIFIESQGWCVLGGAGEDSDRAVKTLNSVDERLFTPNGVALQQPPYSRYHVELGEISSYPPGYKENAGIFSHNNTWIQLAWCKLGFGSKALEYYLSICPSTKEEKIETYRSEPYVYAQMTAGPDAKTFGEAKNTWLTGTAAWSFVVASQGILGVQPDFNGLRVDPCVPKDWKEFSVTRVFRGTTYNISIKNPKGVEKGISEVKVNGTLIEGNVLPLGKPGETLEVQIQMG